MKFLIESFLDFLINTHPSNPIILLLLCSKPILVSVPIILIKCKRHLLQREKAVFFTVPVKRTSHSECYTVRKNPWDPLNRRKGRAQS
jgi:hypothetical protein